MRLSKYAFGIALAGLLSASPVWAEVPTAPQPGADYNYYATAADQATPASPSDKAVAPAPEAAACCEEEAEEENPCGEAWTLQSWLQPCRCEDSQFTYGGWINGGVTGNGHNAPGQNANYPVSFNTQSNGVMANQLWGWAERASKTDGCGWDWGFRVDYLFGSDARFTQAYGDVGYDNDWDTSAIYGSALPQLYAVVSYNDVNVKLGHFFTIIGNEVVPATGNFFYSHAYTMLYGEPFTHTGALADWKMNDQVTLYGGYVQGWDSGFNNANEAGMFLGGISWTSEDEVNSLAYMLTAGDWGNGTAGVAPTSGDLYMHSIVFKHKFESEWQYIFQSDLGSNANANGQNGTTAWYGVNQYLIKELNCCWSVGGRFEWFRDQDGVRVIDVNGNGNAGDYWALTLGANWKPHTNIIVRPEVRYDWHTGGGTPYANATQAEQFTFGVDGIFVF